MLVERVDKVFSDGRWNGCTNIDFWKGKYYLVFRSAMGHDKSLPGQITLLESADTKSWSSSVVIDTDKDDRDPKFLATDQRLYIYYTNEPHERTLVSFTADGEKWSEPVLVYKDGYSFWKPKARAGVYYVAADIKNQVELLRSEDGLNWQLVSIITQGNRCTETSLVFLKDDSLLAITRQNTSPNYPRFSFSRPPYSEWDHVEGTFFFQGPGVALVGDTIVVGGRVLAEDFESPPDEKLGDHRTALLTFNLEEMRLEWQANLPTQWGGDLSYPGILPLGDNRALVSFYDGKGGWPHFGKSKGPNDILLATIVL